MRRVIPITVLILLAIVGSVAALEAVGTVKKVDAEKGVIEVFANGKDRVLTVAKDIQVLGTNGQALAKGVAAPELKEGAEVTITVEMGQAGPVLHTIRLGKQGGGPANVQMSGKPSVGFKPLTEMTAGDRYKGEDGGLYGGGKNEPPTAHLDAARKETAKIVPLDADGKPAKDGTIGLVSISMSNATQEYSLFKILADKDPRKSTLVTIVDCAQGGQAMAQWVDPAGRPWIEAERRLAAAHVSPKQVQVIWVKLANVRPTGELAEHGKKLQKDTLALLHNAKGKFPNLRIAYLGSRIYGGYAVTPLNPEPYAYEGAFAARWLIQDQIKGNADLKFDDANGPATAPLLLWGPYFWADGTTPRKSDNLVWERTDLGGDGTHPSESGRRKAADMLLKFFKQDPLASTWFAGK